MGDPTDYQLVNEECLDLLGDAIDELRYFADMLIEEGEVRGLIGDREIPRLWSRHIINSAVLAPFLPSGSTRVADIGTGAGFPGVVLALMRPDVDFTLIESMERRCQWLIEVQDELGIDNIHIVHDRSENVPKSERFDAVTSRAVAKLRKLVPLTAHLVRGGGDFLALKGERAQGEVDEAKYIFRKAGLVDVTIHPVSSPMDKSITRVVHAVKKQ